MPAIFRDAWGWHATIMEADIARNFHHDYERGGERMSESLRGQIERGRRVSAVDYNNAVDRIDATSAAFDEIFDRCDAILTAAAAGPAPRGLESTGNPAFCTLWTFAGMPAITLPLLSAGNGLPMGVQLVGRRGDDARLLRTARWLVRWARESTAAQAEHGDDMSGKFAKIVMGVIAVTLAVLFFLPPALKLKDPALIIVLLIGVAAMVYSFIEFVREEDDAEPGDGSLAARARDVERYALRGSTIPPRAGALPGSPWPSAGSRDSGASPKATAMTPASSKPAPAPCSRRRPAAVARRPARRRRVRAAAAGRRREGFERGGARRRIRSRKRHLRSGPAAPPAARGLPGADLVAFCREERQGDPALLERLLGAALQGQGQHQGVADVASHGVRAEALDAGQRGARARLRLLRATELESRTRRRSRRGRSLRRARTCLRGRSRPAPGLPPAHRRGGRRRAASVPLPT